jgi:putative Holliday junction resolvase
MPTAVKTVLALDVGDKRIGVAAANTIARLANPLTTLARSETVLDELVQLVEAQTAAALVVGLPRGLGGQSTAQSQATKAFVKTLEARLGVPIYLQDEAVTSHQAEAELKARGKTYAKGDIDALAATYILEDWLKQHPEVVDV